MQRYYKEADMQHQQHINYAASRTYNCKRLPVYQCGKIAWHKQLIGDIP